MQFCTRATNSNMNIAVYCHFGRREEPKIVARAQEMDFRFRAEHSEVRNDIFCKRVWNDKTCKRGLNFRIRRRVGVAEGGVDSEV